MRIQADDSHRYLLAEKAFSRIVIFEQRDKVGGLWNHLPCPSDRSSMLPVPQTDPYGTTESGTTNGHLPTNGSDHVHESVLTDVLSPIYDLLETNIPRGLMGFSDLNWSDDCQLFPQHDTVLNYLKEYSAPVQHLIQFKMKVQDVAPLEDGKWNVTLRDLRGNNEESQVFDAVLVGSGHFDVPFVPSMAGIEAWHEAYPGCITHSKFYRKPDDFEGKKCVVVGNSASGVDIGAQIMTACRLPLLQSSKSESFLQPDLSATKVEKPQITEYIVEGRSLRFADGTVESDIDAIVYCTGYFYSYPFLQSLNPPLVTTGEYVENLYQHIFYRACPTLAFVALNQKIIPFPVAEAQSAVIARVWSGRLRLPSDHEMEQWEREQVQQSGGGRSFHVLQFPKDADYINMLHDWAISGDQKQANHCHELRRRRMSSASVERRPSIVEAVGKEPPYWGEKEYWTRERFPAIKKAFQNFGGERHTKRTLQDVGKLLAMTSSISVNSTVQDDEIDS